MTRANTLLKQELHRYIPVFHAMWASFQLLAVLRTAIALRSAPMAGAGQEQTAFRVSLASSKIFQGTENARRVLPTRTARRMARIPVTVMPVSPEISNLRILEDRRRASSATAARPASTRLQRELRTATFAPRASTPSQVSNPALSAKPANTSTKKAPVHATTATGASSRKGLVSTPSATTAWPEHSLKLQAAASVKLAQPESSREMRRNQFAAANAQTARIPLSPELIQTWTARNARPAHTETPQGHLRVSHALQTKPLLQGAMIRLPASAWRGSHGTAEPESARRACPLRFPSEASATHVLRTATAMGLSN